MGWLTGLQYKELERLTPEEARQRRFLNELTRQRKALEVQTSRLSPANQFHLNQLKEFQSKFQNELDARKARLKEFDPTSRAHISNRAKLFQLLQKQSLLQSKATQEAARRKMQAQAVARSTSGFANTVYGTHAWLTASSLPNGQSKLRYKHPGMVIPCIERIIRREVMFAFGHGGHGHKVRKRKGLFSKIGC